VINETPGQIVTVSFDVFIPTVGVSGASVYIGADMGGGGFGNVTDRGPQMTWLANGQFIANEKGVNKVLLPSFPVGVWQNIRVEIDLESDTYDIHHGVDGGAQQLLGAGVLFRATSPLNKLDRFSIAHFGATTPVSEVYFDNVAVSIPEGCYPDCDANGILDIDDFVCFQTFFAFGSEYADCDDNGILDVDDFICYQTFFAIGCP
jgi:hypothetical protein